MRLKCETSADAAEMLYAIGLWASEAADSKDHYATQERIAIIQALDAALRCIRPKRDSLPMDPKLIEPNLTT